VSQVWPTALVAALILAEAIGGRLFGRPLYGLRDTEVSLGLVAGWALGAVATAGLSAAAIGFCFQHRLATASATWIGFAAAIVAADLVYYLWHRASHRVGWLWATHMAHHTAPRMNVLASVRQGWTDIVSGTWLVWAPLGFLGLSPAMVATYFVVLFLWEAATHNEWVPRLGPLEWVFVTPSNHRIHHSLQAAHWNRNYGGVLILWDRMFGTYVAEGPEPVRAFGLAGIDDGAGPVGIVLRGWREWAGVRDFATGRSMRMDPNARGRSKAILGVNEESGPDRVSTRA
jgi:sterol desaturase/sphingolipid hydroxylase (fatty acid hydroxylase superfamily)